jgi:alpha-beta hydrolase superfamily lysophospholipase
VRPTLAGVSALLEPGGHWLAPALFSPEFRRREPERVAELLRTFGRHRAPAHGVLAHWWATVYHDTTSRLGQIQAPTLVMHGARDGLAPIANARLLAARIPDAELAIVPGAGHAYAMEHPEAAYELFIRWLDRREPIAPGIARRGLVARAEPLTRAFGLPVGALRTGGSLAGMAGERILKARRAGRTHVAVD